MDGVKEIAASPLGVAIESLHCTIAIDGGHLVQTCQATSLIKPQFNRREKVGLCSCTLSAKRVCIVGLIKSS